MTHALSNTHRACLITIYLDNDLRDDALPYAFGMKVTRRNPRTINIYGKQVYRVS